MKLPPRLKKTERTPRRRLLANAVGSTSAVGSMLLDLVSHIPESKEPASAHPAARSRRIAQSAARRAAAISGALSLPPGPIGFSTILPDLLAIWRVQQKMVADIAAVFGQEAFLGRETMIYCLFKHGGAALLRDLVVRAGERVIIRRAALSVVRQALEKAGVRVTQQVVEKSLSRWLPLVGALGMGAYAYYDTMQVAASAIDLFSKELMLEPEKGVGEPPLLPA